MTARIYSLMFHFFRDDMPLEVRAMFIADYNDALGDLPQAAIKQAISERIRSADRRKPNAGEIRKRAKELLERPAPTTADNQSFPPVVIDESELSRRRDQQAELRREFPMLKRMGDE